MGQFQPQTAGVTRHHEAWQAGLDDHRIAHQHIGAGLPNARVGPDDRHDPHSPVERGQVERDFGAAIVQSDWARELGQQIFGRGRASAAGRCSVTTGPDLTHRPIPGVNQPPVNVAQRHPKAALSKEVSHRIGGVIACQCQDTQIDRC